MVQEGQIGVSSTTEGQEDSKQPADVQQQEETKIDEPENPKPIDESNSEEPIEPMEAPSSTIPEVVHTVEDIYDFDDMSGIKWYMKWKIDIEKEMGDVDLEEVEDGDLSDIEAEILAEL